MSINHLQQTAQTQMPQQIPYYQPQMFQQQNNSKAMTWVQGIEGAKAFLTAPGMTIPLWDSENQSIYIKSSDPNGIPRPLTILDYTIRQISEDAEKPQVDTSQFVTKDEFNELKDMISDLKDSIAAQNRPHNNYRKGGNRNDG